ncbi:branched-chain amino acid ABC transporter permease [Phreatobacter cathodiphilus]|uniref:Branched-chain amino acid ABC transporter permease n=1 Tax=Phreatobacter cathodiphilus TaxID=1868589 RepID=A0A2S0NBU0_9HYPH|nr:branched-chain amino acid ABC transporter permease [Phreatobacter cathodiphilus]AVO45628.1 branched-chain amino acid ABC transporter permease [Phreatobacter cathodiphilus]
MTAVTSTAPAAAEGSRNLTRTLLLGLLVLAAALPFLVGKSGFISNFTFLQLSLMIVYAIAVLGLNLLTGFNGQISLGHGAFFAVGAYTAAILIEQFGVNYWLTLPAAAVLCFVIGYLFGLPALRLEGHYLALATFGLAIAVPQMLKYKHLEPLTNGVMGINLLKPDAPFGLPLSGDQWMYLVVLVVAVGMFWMARNLLNSRPGRAMVAIRDHTLAAGTMGIDTARYKATVFGISALYVGIAGALHAIIFEFVSPDSFRFELSIAILVGAVVGGVASLPGAVIGGIFVQFIEKYADAMTKKLTQAIHLPLELQPWTLYGITLIVLIYVMPGGIAGGLAALWARLRRPSPGG